MPQLQIAAHDGGHFNAYIALPATTPAPAIIVIQEIFGVNAEMRAKCDKLASQGYIAICPDLFWRIEPGIELIDSVPEELQRAFDLFGQFEIEKGAEDLKATLAAIRNHESCNGKVAAIGYCLGGKLAYIMATQSDVDAAVSYYGVAIETMLGEASRITKPLLMHIAEKDEFVPPQAQAQIKSALANHPQIAIYSYPGMDHAFARNGGMHYNAEAANLANARTDDFLKTNLV